MSGEKKGIVKKAKDLVNKARKTVKKIINNIKFFYDTTWNSFRFVTTYYTFACCCKHSSHSI